MSLKYRLHYFDICITPCILFALAAFPITKLRLEHLNVLQRKMLPRIIGWRRIQGEDWHDTMERMNTRMQMGYRQYQWLQWDTRFAKAQWRLITHIMRSDLQLWSKDLCKQRFIDIPDARCIFQPRRSPGRPRCRWDDHIQNFCDYYFPDRHKEYWMDILKHENTDLLEEAFVRFLTGRPP